MNLLHAHADRRLLELTDETNRLAKARLVRRDALQVSVSKAIAQMASDGLRGAEREFAEETARGTATGFDPHRLHLPWNALATRDLFVATPSAGGYLVGTDILNARDILRPWSVTARAGITIEDGLTGDNVLPITNAKATVSWMSSETASASPSTPTLSATTMQPKVAIGVIQASRHLIKQARDPERYIRRELLNTAGSVVDAAVLNGSGASGQPTGILNTESLLTQTGTTLQHAGVTSMKQKCATANVDDERIVFLSTPGIRELLENRLRTGNGSRYVWDEDKLADRPAFVSTDMPAATMLAGDFSNVWLGLWGSGIVIETNPYDPTLFKTGVLQLRVIVSMDVALGCSPSAFVKATSIT